MYQMFILCVLFIPLNPNETSKRPLRIQPNVQSIEIQVDFITIRLQKVPTCTALLLGKV